MSIRGTRLRFLATLALAATCFLPVAEAQVRLVKDISPPFAGGSSPEFKLVDGSRTFLTAASMNDGNELWVTDGTTAGTRQVKDLSPGYWATIFSADQRQPGADFVSASGQVFWRFSGEYGRRFELWKTDGTDLGTSLVFESGSGCSPAPYLSSAPKFWAAARGDELYFLPATCGHKIWKVSGPVPSASLVADVPAKSIFNVNGNLVAMSETTVYLNSDPASGFVAPLPPFRLDFEPLAVPGALLFLSTNGTTRELWSTDGTPAGTTRRATIPASLPSRILGVLGSKALLPHAGGLYAVDLISGEATSIPAPTGIAHAASFVDHLVLIVDRTVAGTRNREVWRTDGTAAGTVSLRVLQPANISTPEPYAVVGGKLYFQGRDPEHGAEPWVTDGTTDGTKMLADINPGTGNSYPTMVGMGSQLLIAAYSPDYGDEIFSFDGTSAGLTLLANIWDDSGAGSPRELAVGGAHLFFDAYYPGAGRAPWATDGTDAGTQLLVDQYGSYSAYITPFGSIGSKFYFNSGDSGNYDMFETDGTPTNTRGLGAEIPALKNMRILGSAQLPERLVLFREGGYGSGNESVISFDGTAAGIKVLPFVGSSGQATTYRGRVYANDQSRYLLSTDGTSEGTRTLAEVSPYSFQPVDDQLFFTGHSATYGIELWTTDGTTEGTRNVADLAPGTAWSSINSMMRMDGKLFFFRDGTELWTSDGTAAGTYAITTVPSRPKLLAFSTGSRILFYATDSRGAELWQSDGTAAGTSLLADICPGPGSSGDLYDAVMLGGILYFSATDCSSGMELWMSDGSSAGTNRVDDIAPGAVSSSPLGFAQLAGEIYFSAYRPDVGRELFAYRPERTQSSTSLALSASAMILGDTLELTATVISEGFATPTGAVEFIVNDEARRTAPLISGSGTARIEGLGGGAHVIRARYVGDSLLASSSSAPQTVTVTPQSATISATISASEAIYGAPLTLDMQLTGAFPFPHLPVGVFVVREGGVQIAAGAVVGTAAALALPRLSAGVHTLALSYERDASFVTEVVALTVTVVPATPTIVVTGLPAFMEPGARVRIDATLQRPYPTLTTGVMRVLDGTQLLVEYPPGLTGFGYFLGPLSEGPHEIVIEFGGDPNHAAATVRKTVLVTYSPQILTVSPAGVCRGQSFFNFAIDGQYFDASTVVAINTQALTTQFINSGRLLASNASALPASSSGQLSITRADGATRQLSLPFEWSYGAPSVTPPPALAVVATHTIDRFQAVSSATSPAFAAWLDSGSATDDCTYAAPLRLPRTLSGVAITGTTPVLVGVSTIQFPFRDTAGNEARAGANLKVIPRGSLDGDVLVTAIDMVILANHLVGNIRQGTAPFTSPLEAGDLNADGRVNSVDLVILANYLVGNITVIPAR